MLILVPDYLVQELESKVAKIDPDIKLIPISVDGEFSCDSSDLEKLEVLFRFFPNDQFDKGFSVESVNKVLRVAKSLRWIHSHSTGVNDLFIPEITERGIILTNSGQVHSGPVAETVMAFLLAIAKRLPEHFRYQERHSWKRLQSLELRGMTVGIVGLGNIGLAVARLCNSFGMRVLGVKRNPTANLDSSITKIYSFSELDKMISESDFLVLTAPGTKETYRIINESNLKLFKPTAYLINVSRGSLVDQTALTKALLEKRLAGACLDVFEIEPLPSNDILYRLDNVIITPHNAASSPNMKHKVIEFFLENLKLYLQKKELMNIVDPKKGY